MVCQSFIPGSALCAENAYKSFIEDNPLYFIEFIVYLL